MLVHTPGEEDAKTDTLLASVHSELSALRQELEVLTKRARAREEVDAKDTKTAVSGLSNLLQTCQKAEANLDACRKQRSQVVQGGYALDLELARTSVRCALDRLRDCREAGEVPG